MINTELLMYFWPAYNCGYIILGISKNVQVHAIQTSLRLFHLRVSVNKVGLWSRFLATFLHLITLRLLPLLWLHISNLILVYQNLYSCWCLIYLFIAISVSSIIIKNFAYVNREIRTAHILSVFTEDVYFTVGYIPVLTFI